MEKNKDFSAAAQTWDEKPQRIYLAEAVAKAIIEKVALNRNMEALEFGSGTGLVTFHLQQHLKHVTAMDNAEGMLDVVAQKARAANITNVSTCFNSNIVPSLIPENYDLIFSSMVLHHIGNIDSTLKALVSGLKKGGILALADLVVEDGSFHDSAQAIEHHGIDPVTLIDQLHGFGLTKTEYIIAHKIVKHRGAVDDVYPVFLLLAYKK